MCRNPRPERGLFEDSWELHSGRFKGGWPGEICLLRSRFLSPQLVGMTSLLSGLVHELPDNLEKALSIILGGTSKERGMRTTFTEGTKRLDFQPAAYVPQDTEFRQTFNGSHRAKWKFHEDHPSS